MSGRARMPLKVYVDVGEPVWSTNGLEFDTYEDAWAYGSGLLFRWMAVREFAVVPVTSGFAGQLTTEAINKIRVVE